MQPSLSLNLTRPAGGSAPGLIIEQEKYGRTDGYLSRAGMHRILWALLRDEQPEEPDCFLGGKTFINVYRYDLALQYQLFASRGELGERIVQDDLFTEKIKFAFEQEKPLQYPCFGLVAVEFFGDRAWDHTAQQIAPPDLTASATAVRAAGKIYGTAAVSYRIHRDRYSLALSERVEAQENKYSSVVYAIHKGGPTWERITAPPGLEETGQQCFGGGGGQLNPVPPEDEKPPPTAPHRDARVVRDYCSQEITLDTSK